MIYLIIKEDNLFCHEGDKGCEYINEHGEYEIWRDEGYHKYLEEYGEHFNEKLAEYASNQLINSDGTNHYWNKNDVLNTLATLSVRLPKNVTPCDFQYLVNKEYAEHFGAKDLVAKTEIDIIKLALNEISNPNFYEGEYFLHYISDLMKQGQYVEF